MILDLGKARSHRVPNLGYRGAESPGWFDVLPKTSARDMVHKQSHCRDEAANHQLLRAAAFWIIQIVSTEECSFKLNTKFDADSLLTHFECNSHTVHKFSQGYLLPPLTSTVKSSLFMHVHSSPLSLAARLHLCRIIHSPYINNGWAFSRQTS